MTEICANVNVVLQLYVLNIKKNINYTNFIGIGRPVKARTTASSS